MIIPHLNETIELKDYRSFRYYSNILILILITKKQYLIIIDWIPIQNQRVFGQDITNHINQTIDDNHNNNIKKQENNNNTLKLKSSGFELIVNDQNIRNNGNTESIILTCFGYPLLSLIPNQPYIKCELCSECQSQQMCQSNELDLCGCNQYLSALIITLSYLYIHSLFIFVFSINHNLLLFDLNDYTLHLNEYNIDWNNNNEWNQIINDYDLNNNNVENENILKNSILALHPNQNKNDINGKKEKKKMIIMIIYQREKKKKKKTKKMMIIIIIFIFKVIFIFFCFVFY